MNNGSIYKDIVAILNNIRNIVIVSLYYSLLYRLGHAFI
jgi:hypothetical protein